MTEMLDAGLGSIWPPALYIAKDIVTYSFRENALAVSVPYSIPNPAASPSPIY
jgi:hypothetical protein